MSPVSCSCWRAGHAGASRDSSAVTLSTELATSDCVTISRRVMLWIAQPMPSMKQRTRMVWMFQPWRPPEWNPARAHERETQQVLKGWIFHVNKSSVQQRLSSTSTTAEAPRITLRNSNGLKIASDHRQADSSRHCNPSNKRQASVWFLANSQKRQRNVGIFTNNGCENRLTSNFYHNKQPTICIIRDNHKKAGESGVLK